MKLGDVLRKERERKRLTMEELAAQLGITIEEYQGFEGGSSVIEEWGPKLAQLAIKLSTPTSRLISETGKSAQAMSREGQCGRLIRTQREKRQLSQDDMAKQLGWPIEQYLDIENGRTPLEVFGPLLLRFAELIDQPIFNIFYPCGLPFNNLDDYP